MLPAGPRGDASTLSAQSHGAPRRLPLCGASQKPRSCKRRRGATSATAIAAFRREPEAWSCERRDATSATATAALRRQPEVQRARPVGARCSMRCTEWPRAERPSPRRGSFHAKCVPVRLRCARAAGRARPLRDHPPLGAPHCARVVDDIRQRATAVRLAGGTACDDVRGLARRGRRRERREHRRGSGWSRGPQPTSNERSGLESRATRSRSPSTT